MLITLLANPQQAQPWVLEVPFSIFHTLHFVNFRNRKAFLTMLFRIFTIIRDLLISSDV